MAHILYDDRKQIGPIEDWTRLEVPAQEKIVMGKVFDTIPRSDQCSFTSPKPVSRRSKLRVLIDGKTELTLDKIKLKGGTHVTATIVATRAVSFADKAKLKL